jgi:serine/threonine protein kinase
MPKMKSHPSREKLSAYNLGQLTPDEATTIESHISECVPCCDTIISLSSEDTFVGLLKDARQLVVDQNLDHQGAKPSSSQGEFPPELAEHPRYEIVRLIGKGGMGDVYEAIHRKMERRVALKVINRELFQKAEAVNRFHREVKTAAQLSHPNIVTSYDADQASDFHFMVMEYVDGVDLSQTVKDQGALPIADACDYIRQAATGLQHAHERGMVHRDIKPHNLMVTADGTIKILDFGLASLAPEANASPDTAAPRSDLTVVGAIMGTPDFISPEQAKDARQVDIRSDIYSLGATLYFLLSGRVPFDDGSVMHKLQSHAQIEPAPLDAVRADVPEELVGITSRMMAKNPDERYLTPREVADALESFLRTWRPDEATSLGQELSSGGNMSGSGGKKSRVGDAGWDWRFVLAKILLAIAWILMVIACIPVSLIIHEAWIFDVESYAIGRVGDLVPAYLLPALCFSTIAGALFVFHRSNADLRRSNGGDRRLLRMKPSEALSVAAVFVAGSLATVLYYAQVNKWSYVEATGSVVAFSPQQLDEMPKVDLDPSERAVELWISGDDASLVQRGDRVQLQFAGWPAVESQGLFQGRVITISPTADGAGKFRILVKESDNDSWPDERYLLPGVRASGWVITAAQKPVDNRKRSRPSEN